MSLREALQRIEEQGTVDWKVGGHKVERPPDVTQGRSDDRFNVDPDPDQRLLWRSNNVAPRNLKLNKLGSFFPWSSFQESALDLVPCTVLFPIHSNTSFQFVFRVTRDIGL